jgi:hypothetical protein
MSGLRADRVLRPFVIPWRSTVEGSVAIRRIP